MFGVTLKLSIESSYLQTYLMFVNTVDFFFSAFSKASFSLHYSEVYDLIYFVISRALFFASVEI